MRGIRDTRLLLLGCDFGLQIGGHALEIRNHHLDLRHTAALLVDLEALQAKSACHAISSFLNSTEHDVTGPTRT